MNPIIKNEIAGILRAHPLFREASEELMEKTLTEQVAKRYRFEAGQVAYSSKTRRVQVGILLSGTARVRTGAAEEQVLLKPLSVGELFGIANLYAEEEPFPTSILTVTRAEILFLDGAAVKTLIENDPAVLRNYLTLQSKKIVYLNRKIRTLTAGSAEKKLAVFLLENESEGLFTPPCSMSGLSEMLGLGRASLYRAIDRLAELGLVEKRGRSLFLPDIDALSRFI